MTVNPDRWRRIEELCHAALERDVTERSAFVATACGVDSDLRREVEALLAHAESAERFLGEPVPALAARALASDTIDLIGRRIGEYEIVSRLGAGGMGEVYRARDRGLGRDVAIKMLPPAFTADRERLARFEREARVLASLNHPNIGTIYGLERIADVPALVLELVEGPTLADRLAQPSAGGHQPSRGVAIAEALAIARQIADALEAAHEKGIVHRDLKPANIKITPAGTVKVLDFGLAKAGEGSGPDVSHSPTLTIGGTREGALLGTAAYMSPEQARGLPVDKRTDIWAFGCVLFELLTGSMAFPGATVSDHIAAILDRDPEWNALPASTPSAIERLLRRCLEKNPKRRLHDIADARMEIDDALIAPVVAPGPSRRRFDWLVWSVGAVSLATVSSWTAWKIADSRRAPIVRPVTRFVIQPPSVVSFNNEGGYAISPDGSQLAYVAGQGNTQQLILRRLDEFEGAPVAGTQGALGPFFSADGQWVGFFSAGKLLKVSVRGGAAPISLCGGIDMGGLNGATWLGDDTVIFAGHERSLHRVSAEGGEPQPLTTIDQATHEVDHHSPAVLPGGRAMLFAVHRSEDRFSIAVQSLESGHRKVLVESGFSPRYLPSGHIVFARGTAILAVPFDPNRLEIIGPPVTLVEHVATRARDGYGAFQLAESGALVFESGSSAAGRVLVWVDRSGAEIPLAISPRAFTTPRVSPDGKTVAFAAGDGDRRDIWTYDLAADTLRRLTSEGDNQAPLWTPDGRRLTYTARREGVQRVMWVPANGDGPAESLTTSPNLLWPNAWTVDSSALIYTEQPPTDLSRLFVLHLDGEHRSEPLTAYNRGGSRQARLSADGRWLAFTAADAGPVQVYAGPFPPSGARHQVTVDNGREPKWSPNGRELFYRFRTRVFAVPVDTTRGFSAGKPVVLFEGPYVVGGGSVGGLDYDVAPDGRFLMIKPTEEEQAPPRLNIVLNWIDEVAHRVPSGARR
jgi:eukaryotic-like serine/threonine-protein kinase